MRQPGGRAQDLEYEAVTLESLHRLPSVIAHFGSSLRGPSSRSIASSPRPNPLKLLPRFPRIEACIT